MTAATAAAAETMMSSTVVSGKDMLSGHEVRSVEVGFHLISSAGVVWQQPAVVLPWWWQEQA